MYTIKVLSKEEYAILLQQHKVVYNSAEFCELNKKKVDEIVYIGIFKDNKPRFAMNIGIKGNVAKIPFSAPFAYPETTKKKMGIENYELAAEVLDEYMKKKKISCAYITLPPCFYDNNVVTAWTNVLNRNKWEIDCIDISHSIELKNVSMNEYLQSLDTNGRRNLKIADKEKLNLVLCKDDDEIELAYGIIKSNREYKGYPLRMSCEQVIDTMKVVPSQMYIVKADNMDIAAALVYEVNKEVVQLIYWGDIPGVESKKAMNYLGRELVSIYSRRGYRYLDIGPSTQDGIFNYGLCEFKESIGCKRDLKIRLKKYYDN